MATVLIQVGIGLAVSYGLSLLTRALTPNPAPTTNEGPRLDSIQLTTSAEGSTINRLAGRMRLGGQLIWCSQFREVVTQTQETTGGDGKGIGGAPEQTTINIKYQYYVSFAIAFCEGNSKTDLSRAWADGKEMELNRYTFRFYPGTSTQTPDPKIEATEGAGNVPGYRNVCYIVFEEMLLEEFGNRIPQITAEIVCPLVTSDPDDLQNSARAFNLIPASGETIYGSSLQLQIRGFTPGAGFFPSQITTAPDNSHNAFRLPDAVRSLDELVRSQTNLSAVSIVVSWFGTDLRCDQCLVIPKHEGMTRLIFPNDWTVEAYTRATAQTVSLDANGRVVFGGTPSDATITQCIQYIRDVLGKRVVFYPFIMMDIPGGNSLNNPYSNNAASVGQPAFPWRGRITCSPAAGFTGSPDLSAGAATQVNTFFDRTEGYTRFITHYANLCAAAGGVDSFIIGSELIGLTTVRSAAGTYPAVTKLVALAATVKAIVGATKVGYAADWSEQTHESAQGQWFNLDPLWSSANVDFVGIDNYMPMTDWRDGGAHLDFNAATGPTTEYDQTYLRSQIEGGEYFAYYYASDADRVNQVRTPITDATYGKPWVFRRKDLRSWWSNQHFNRPSWVESGSPTAWVPFSKPIYFTEFGCPAVNKGTNQPNVFYDPKSSESHFPYFSSGLRDDFIQRLYLETMISYWRDNSPIHSGLKMVEPINMFIWTWDARPYPDYPARTDVWSDGPLWFLGHWLTGRVDGIVLARLIRAYCLSCGLTDAQIEVNKLYGAGGIVRGFVINNVMSMRDAIQALANSHSFDAYESDGKIKFILRSNVQQLTVSSDMFVVDETDMIGFTLTRGQETELPSDVKITFIDEYNDYQTAAVNGSTSKGSSQNTGQVQLPEVLSTPYAQALGDSIVQQAWIGRDSGEVRLPLSLLRLEPGDVITIPDAGRNLDIRLTKIDTGDERKSDFQTFDIGMFSLPPLVETNRVPPVAELFGAVMLEWVDLPLFSADQAFAWSPMIAAHADPWPGGVNIYRELSDGSFAFVMQTSKHARIGELVQNFPAKLPSRIVNNSPDATHAAPVSTDELIVKLYYGTLSSVSIGVMMSSRVALGIQNTATGAWEVVKFATAELIGTKTYRLRDLIRGIMGTNEVMMNPYPAGARVVVLEAAELEPLQVGPSVASAPITYRWGPSRYPVDDVTYVEGERYGFRTAYIPLSPVHLRLFISGSDLLIKWRNRTRDPQAFGSWDLQPGLYEAFERYRVIIYADNTFTTIKRVAIVDGHPAGYDTEGFELRPEYTYLAADQTTDFGGAQTTLYVGIMQWGTDYGAWGREQRATLDTVAATVYPFPV
jgi:hypothetical protein